MIPVTVVGSYPRIGDHPEEQKLRKAIEQLDQGEITRAQLGEIEDKVTQEIIEEQIKLGVDLPSDGQIRWEDSISYLARSLKGCTINGLVRYFDTNLYYRQPVIHEKLRYEQPILIRDFQWAQKIAGNQPIKVILTGPYSLARLSKDEVYRDLRKLVWEWAGILNQELTALTQAGAKFIELDEPSILSNPEDRQLWSKAIDMATHGVNGAYLSLYLSNGFADQIWEELQQLPVNELALDLTIGHPHVSLLHRYKVTKKICAGVVDARNTLMEKPDRLGAHIEKVQEVLGANLMYLAPNYSLEFLPRDTAREKLKLLSKAAHGMEKTERTTDRKKEKINENSRGRKGVRDKGSFSHNNGWEFPKAGLSQKR